MNPTETMAPERTETGLRLGALTKEAIAEYKETLKLFRSVRPVGATNRAEGRRAVRAFNAFFMKEQLALLRDG